MKKKEEERKKNDTSHRINRSWSLGNLARHVLPRNRGFWKEDTREVFRMCKGILHQTRTVYFGGVKVSVAAGVGLESRHSVDTCRVRLCEMSPSSSRG